MSFSLSINRIALLVCETKRKKHERITKDEKREKNSNQERVGAILNAYMLKIRIRNKKKQQQQ